MKSHVSRARLTILKTRYVSYVEDHASRVGLTTFKTRWVSYV